MVLLDILSKYRSILTDTTIDIISNLGDFESVSCGSSTMASE